MVKRALGLLLCCLLVGCETVHDNIFNMTSCPIRVTYSVANIHENTVNLAPGKSAGGFGSGFARVDSLTIAARDGVAHSYGRVDLAGLRPRFAIEDRFGWFKDGLHYLREKPKKFPTADQTCINP